MTTAIDVAGLVVVAVGVVEIIIAMTWLWQDRRNDRSA